MPSCSNHHIHFPKMASPEEWAQENPILLISQIGYEKSADGTIRVKVGDGLRKWTELPYGDDGAGGGTGGGGTPGTGGTGTFTNPNPTTVAWGNIPAGTDLSGLSWQEILEKQLYPYIEPAFTSFSISTFGGTTKEVGTQIAADGTLTFTTSATANIEQNSMSLKDHTGTVVLSNFSTSPQNIKHAAWTSTNPGTTTWTLSGKSTSGKTFTRTVGINWLFRVYYGELPTDTIDEAGIKGLRVGNLSGNRAGTYSFNAGGYKYFAFPSNLGKPSTFKDTSNNLPIPVDELSSVTVTNANGVRILYYVFRTSNVLGGSINIAVN